MGSNVTLRSNVYINKTQRRNDAEFVHHLRDYDTLCKYYDPVYRTSEVPLTKVQYAIMNHGSPKCSLEKGTQSWGIPVGSERFVCRCEELQCPQYSTCSALENFELITRETDSDKQEVPIVLSDSIDHCSPKEEPESANRREEQATSSAQSDNADTSDTPQSTQSDGCSTIKNAEQRPAEPCQQQDGNPPELPQAKVVSGILYSSQDTIINADISSRIYVNAGPGTGKTYIVVKRLQKLLELGSSDKAVLVLCFSKNAVYVIKERLRTEMGNCIDALVADERLIIRTFDSFATYMLSDDLPKGLDYNQRVELFTKKITENPDVLSGVEYLIVDEIQDTVGVRARMLQSVVERSRFGILLLGDRCQAIYDWSARSTSDWTSTDLFSWIGSQGFQIYELEKNYRQDMEIAKLGDMMRCALLGDSEDEQERTLTLCKEKIENLWPGYAMSELSQNLHQKSDLILCKTNGEVAAVSDLLYGGSKFVEHTVRESADHKTLAPWIGMIFGGYTEPIISKEDFLARAEMYGVEDAEMKWDTLLTLDSHTRSAVLHRLEVLTRLAAMDDLPDICLNCPGNGVIVSTVHRAKGSEADHAYWINSPLAFDNHGDEDGVKSDALKAAYVAMTRAKEDIRTVSPETLYLRSLGDNRWIKTGLARNKRVFCAGITLQPEDVDAVSCASGPDAEQMQDIIRSLTPGLDVELYPLPNSPSFEIFFDGIPIGKTTATFTQALFEGFWATNKNSNMPVSIDSAYISSLVTVIQLGGTDVENVYQASGCWLGYELGGFAHINYT